MEEKATQQGRSQEVKMVRHQFTGYDVASHLAIKERVRLFEEWGAHQPYGVFTSKLRRTLKDELQAWMKEWGFKRKTGGIPGLSKKDMDAILKESDKVKTSVQVRVILLTRIIGDPERIGRLRSIKVEGQPKDHNKLPDGECVTVEKDHE